MSLKEPGLDGGDESGPAYDSDFDYDSNDKTYDLFLSIPSISQIMKCRKKKSSFIYPIKDSIRGLVNTPDVFGVLPVEVREMIATRLPTKDFYALRMASRVMAPIFESATFWKSRFSISGKYGFLYYTIQEFTSHKTNDGTDWRSLYACMPRLRYTRHLPFQACVWDSLDS